MNGAVDDHAHCVGVVSNLAFDGVSGAFDGDGVGGHLECVCVGGVPPVDPMVYQPGQNVNHLPAVGQAQPCFLSWVQALRAASSLSSEVWTEGTS